MPDWLSRVLTRRWVLTPHIAEDSSSFHDQSRYLRILTSSAFRDARSGDLTIPNNVLWVEIGKRCVDEESGRKD
ncbi:hypothetical protein E4U55_003341 [Claviceps digitariae]|nr:hypothetical protein E4U55_003341 [Claviceps digitariae]